MFAWITSGEVRNGVGNTRLIQMGRFVYNVLLCGDMSGEVRMFHAHT